MTVPRPILVLAVYAISSRDMAERYPPCMRVNATVRVPHTDPPVWVLPGGRRVCRREAERIARRMGEVRKR